MLIECRSATQHANTQSLEKMETYGPKDLKLILKLSLEHPLKIFIQKNISPIRELKVSTLSS